MVFREQWRRWCDRTVAGGICFLIIATPLAFGTVHPWAFMTMEALVFLLIALWMTKVTAARSALVSPDALRQARSLVLPLVLFFSVMIFQLAPLPPSWVRALSPATYELYTRSLPDWPEQTPYAEWVALDSAESQVPSSKFQVPSSKFQVPGSEAQVSDSTPQSSVLITQHSVLSTRYSALGTRYSEAGPWLPLSIAPELGKTDLYKLLAYAGFFLLVLLYPFGGKENQRETEERFHRTVLRVVFSMAMVIALLGILQRFAWNGKILWFFVPHDWPGPWPSDAPRASGPFVNSDHFANYLAMLLPLTLAGFVSRLAFTERSKRAASRLVFSASLTLLLMGLLLSLSRGGWGGAIVGIALLLGFLPTERRQRLLGADRQKAARVLVSATFVGILAALYFIGQSGRAQVDRRLEQTVMQDASFDHRLAMWQDTIGMVRDFPVFGVGLGAWPEVFPRYQRPPWSPQFAREAHNDYVEGLAELGVFGLGLLTWFFVAAGLFLYRGLTSAPTKFAPIYAALLASLGAMAFHECFDFNLQIPANALVFTLVLALALRVARRGEQTVAEETTVAPRWRSTLLGATGLVAALLLCVVALRQDRLLYPDNLRSPTSVAEARDLLLSYPALSSMHVALFELTKDRLPLRQRLPALETALWLDPRDPYARDTYARGLVQVGREQDGLRELTRSVFLAPRLSQHESLTSERLALLSEPEQRAVESGLLQANAADRPEAPFELGAFYNAVGRYADAARSYEAAALNADDDRGKLHGLLLGGSALMRARETAKAEALVRQAITVTPRDPRPYRQLISQVYAVKEDIEGAREIVKEGVRNGVPPVPLLLALADTAQKLGNREIAKAALIEALPKQGGSFEVLAALGRVYLQEKNFDRAALTLRKAARLNPDDVSVVSALAAAEEGRYRFAAAQDAYTRALSLDATNTGLRGRYEALLRKMSENQ